MNGVLHLGAEAGGAGGSESDFDALDRLDGNDGLSEAAIQARIPGDVRAQADRDAAATTSKTPPTVSPVR